MHVLHPEMYQSLLLKNYFILHTTLQELWGFLVAPSWNKMISSKYVPDNVTATNVHSSGYFSHQPYAPASIYQIYFTLHL